jgi:hypothetical protein
VSQLVDPAWFVEVEAIAARRKAVNGAAAARSTRQ